MSEKIYIINGARTPVGAFGKSLSKVPNNILGAHAVKHALSRSGVLADSVDEFILGCVGQVGEEAFLARRVALNAGARDDSNAYTVNRLCGSGLQAIQSAAMELYLGEVEIVVAGGSENMSLQPFLDYGARDGWKFGDRLFIDGTKSLVTDPFGNYPMGNTAEKVAEEFCISREDQDSFAFESQQKALRAQKEGILALEIAPIEVKRGRETIIFDQDEHIRPQTTLEGLAKLRPAFKENGSVTAGNSSGINDASAALVMARESTAEKYDLTPMGELVGFAKAGIRPEIMGYAPKVAVERVLQKTGLSMEQMDWIEINEAFASQALAVIRGLNLEVERVNPLGGAIALGHPVGATGAILALRTLHNLQRTKGKFGLVTMCIGGGQAVAAVFKKI